MGVRDPQRTAAKRVLRLKEYIYYYYISINITDSLFSTDPIRLGSIPHNHNSAKVTTELSLRLRTNGT